MLNGGFNRNPQPDWKSILYKTKLKLDWSTNKKLAAAIAEQLEDIQFVAGGLKPSVEPVESIDEMMRFKEDGALLLFGKYRPFGQVSLYCMTYTDTDRILLVVPKPFLDGIRSKDGQELSDESKEHLFDSILDTAEENVLSDSQMLNHAALSDDNPPAVEQARQTLLALGYPPAEVNETYMFAEQAGGTYVDIYFTEDGKMKKMVYNTLTGSLRNEDEEWQGIGVNEVHGS